MASETFLSDIFDILSVDTDCSGGHIIEASVVVPEVDALGNAGVQELFPPQRIERMKLTDTALVLDKVK